MSHPHDRPTTPRRSSLLAFGSMLFGHEHDQRRRSSVTFAEVPDNAHLAQIPRKEAHPGRISPLSPRASVVFGGDHSSDGNGAGSSQEGEVEEEYEPPSALDGPASNELSWTCVSPSYCQSEAVRR